MARSKQSIADIDKIKLIRKHGDDLVDFKPIIALTMRYCGCTYDEIATALEITRQGAEDYIKRLERI